MLNLILRIPQDIVCRAAWPHVSESQSVRRFMAGTDDVSGSSGSFRYLCIAVLVTLTVVISLYPEIALAKIATDATATGWPGVQGKLHDLFDDGIAPLATYAGMGVGVVTMAATDKPVLKGVGAGLAGLGLMVSAGPGIMQTISGTAIF